MKIVHIAQRYHDGFGYHENLLPRYQAALGHEVVVVTSERPKNAARLGPASAPSTGEYMDGAVRIVRLPISWEFRKRFVVFKDLSGALDGERPDYVYHHGVPFFSLLEAARWKKAHPSVFLAADNHADYTACARNMVWRLAYYRAFWASMIKMHAGGIDLVFGVSPERCVFAEKEIGVPAGIIRFLPMGVDVEAAEAAGIGERAPAGGRACGGPGAPLRIVSGGKWFKGKGLEELVDAVRGLDVKLDVFGYLGDETVKELMAGAGDNVSFLGWQDRAGTMSLLRDADLAVWPLQHTTLIEDAIAVGTPLMVRLYGTTSHLIRGNGLYLHGGGADELREALRHTAGDGSVLTAMRARAVEMRGLLSYRAVAAESIEYRHDVAPKRTHLLYRDDTLCRTEVPPLLRRRRS